MQGVPPPPAGDHAHLADGHALTSALAPGHPRPRPRSPHPPNPHPAGGRPILLARLGRAQQLVKPERYDELANALLTLVHRGLTGQLSNAAGAAEQVSARPEVAGAMQHSGGVCGEGLWRSQTVVRTSCWVGGCWWCTSNCWVSPCRLKLCCCR